MGMSLRFVGTSLVISATPQLLDDGPEVSRAFSVLPMPLFSEYGIRGSRAVLRACWSLLWCSSSRAAVGSVSYFKLDPLHSRSALLVQVMARTSSSSAIKGIVGSNSSPSVPDLCSWTASRQYTVVPKPIQISRETHLECAYLAPSVLVVST